QPRAVESELGAALIGEYKPATSARRAQGNNDHRAGAVGRSECACMDESARTLGLGQDRVQFHRRDDVGQLAKRPTMRSDHVNWIGDGQSAHDPDTLESERPTET